MRRLPQLLFATFGVIGLWSGWAGLHHVLASPPDEQDAWRVKGLLSEMERMDRATLEVLSPIEIPKYALPLPSVDVMRVKLVETYQIDGIGEDEVELLGWIAVQHTNPRPAAGEREVTWKTAVMDTEFVGMDLRGQSDLFGEVRVSLDRDRPAIGQVGKIDIPEVAMATALAASGFQEPTDGVEPTGQPPIPPEVAKLIERLERRIEALEADKARRLPPPVRFEDDLPSELLPKKRPKSVPRFDSGPRDVAGSDDGSTPTVTGKTGQKLDGAMKTEKSVEVNKKVEKSTRLKSLKALLKSAKCCRAPVAVTVSMRNLKLEMKTKTHVTWFSVVDTIPPVGHTASVALTPTALVSAGREVGVLKSGVVKFREVVKVVPLSIGSRLLTAMELHKPSAEALRTK